MANKKFSLDTFVYYAYGIINYRNKTVDDVPELLTHLLKFANEYKRIDKYYFIAHTETDTLHIHFVLTMTSTTRLITIFNKISASIEKDIIDNDAITVNKATNFNYQVAYLLHQDADSVKAGKKRYEIDDIITNDSVTAIEGIIASRKGSCDVYYLRDAVLDSLNEFDLMAKLGLALYHRYRFEIQILKEMRASLILMRQEERDKKEELPF